MTRRIVTVIIAVLMCCSVFFLYSCDKEKDVDSAVNTSNENLEELLKEDTFYEKEPEHKATAESGKKVLDVFQGIELVYLRANGAGSADFKNDLKDTEFEVDGFYFKPVTNIYERNSLNVIYDNENICRIKYYISSDWNPLDGKLKKGDKVIVTAEVIWPEAFDNLDYTPLLKKEFTVPDLGEFLTEKKDFTANLIDEIETSFLNVKSNVSFLNDAENVTMEKTYFAKAAPGTEIPGKSKTSLISIVKIDDTYYIANVYDIYTRDNNLYFYVHYYANTFTSVVYNFKTLEESQNELDNIINNEYTYEEII